MNRQKVALLGSFFISMLYLIAKIIRFESFNHFLFWIDTPCVFLYTFGLFYLHFFWITWIPSVIAQADRLKIYLFLSRLVVTSVCSIGLVLGLTRLLSFTEPLDFLSFFNTQLPISVLIFRGFVVNFLIWGIVYVFAILKKAQIAESEVLKLRAENLQNQLQTLKNQLHPHFLFNALNTLKSMVRSQHEKSETFIVNMAHLYRSLLQNQQALFDISEELKHTEAYIFMLQQRFEDSLQIEIRIEASLFSKKIPAFSLLLLLENAVKHNVVASSRPLKIEIWNMENHLLVRNNLQPKYVVEETTQIGLQNLRARYQLLMQADIVIEKTTHYFTVKLPLI
jgi:two-component system, LytTR family, sensor kinase